MAAAARQQLMEILEPGVTALGYELVDIEVNTSRGHGLVRLFIDAESGIALEDCERVSHHVSGVLDVEDPMPGDYRLEVSSPGLDRKLTKPEHFDRFAGETVKLRLQRLVNGRRRISGRLLSRTGDRIGIDVGSKTLEFALSDIDSARLVPDL